jgi:hypothetical protein
MHPIPSLISLPIRPFFHAAESATLSQKSQPESCQKVISRKPTAPVPLANLQGSTFRILNIARESQSHFFATGYARYLYSWVRFSTSIPHSSPLTWQPTSATSYNHSLPKLNPALPDEIQKSEAISMINHRRSTFRRPVPTSVGSFRGGLRPVSCKVCQ